MKDNFKKLFLSVLREESAPASDEAAFEKSLDPGTEKEEFDTEGIASMVDALSSELHEDVAKLEKVIRYLVDPDNASCMLKRLEKVHKSIEFEKLFQPIEKAIEKTAESLAVAIAKINVAITSAGGKRDKRRSEDTAKQAQSTSPY